MTLQRFLTGMADHRCSWPWGLRRFKPRPDAPMTLPAILAQLAFMEAMCALGGFLLMGLFASTPMRGSWWPMRFALGFGLVAGLFGQLLISRAWNRRARLLRASGATEPAPLPKRRWWQTLLVVPFYAFVLFAATPLALWLAIDNALGTWQWRRVRADLVARGEPLTFKELIPPRPPDDQNFAMTPLLRPLLDYAVVVTNGRAEFVWRDPVGRRRMDAIGFPPQIYAAGYSPRKSPRDGRLDLDSYARGIRARPVRRLEGGSRPELGGVGEVPAVRRAPVELPPDLARRYGVVMTNPPTLKDEEAQALVIADPAREVLDYLRRFEPELQEIAEASRRPGSQFPVRWSEGYAVLVPHLAQGKRLCTLFRVRAAARLRAGDPAGAFADTTVLLRLAEKASGDPILIGLLVRLAETSIATAAVWEGLVARQWTDAQVAELQGALLGIDAGPIGVAAMRGERVFANWLYDQWLERPDELRSTLPPEEPADGLLLGPNQPPFPRFLAPRGLLRRNQVAGNRLMDVLIGRLRDPAWSTLATNRLGTEELMRMAGLRPVTPDNVMASLLAPALVKTEDKLARQQAVSRMAGIACALERFRLRHGRFPDALAMLAPAFPGEVPPDPMNGQPFGYRPLENGWYLLWSVGLNGRDDGGVTSEKDNDAVGDWVWPLPLPSVGPRLF